LVLYRTMMIGYAPSRRSRWSMMTLREKENNMMEWTCQFSYRSEAGLLGEERVLTDGLCS
jgi:hypothetical protein